MAWVRLDDGFAMHPKIAGLSDAAFRLHVTALCYAGHQMTDGFVARAVLRVCMGVADQAAELVEAGVWEAEDRGWRIHDYLEFNPSRAEQAAQSAQKRAAGREGGVASGEARRRARGSVPETEPLGSSENEAPASLVLQARAGESVGDPLNPVPSRPLPVTTTTTTGSARDARPETRDPRPAILCGDGEPGLALAIAAWEKSTNRAVTAYDAEFLGDACADPRIGSAWVCEAIQAAAENGQGGRWSYVKAILARWVAEGRRERVPSSQFPVPGGGGGRSRALHGANGGRSSSGASGAGWAALPDAVKGPPPEVIRG